MAVSVVELDQSLAGVGTSYSYPALILPGLASYNVADAAQGAVLQPGTRFVRIAATTASRVAVGTGATASGTSMYMAAGSVEIVGVPPNSGYRVACAAG